MKSSGSFLLALSHLVGPGKRAVKQLRWWFLSCLTVDHSSVSKQWRYGDGDVAVEGRSILCVYEGIAGAGVAADGVGRRRSTDSRAGVRQPRSAYDAKLLAVWWSEAQHSSVGSRGVAAGAAAARTDGTAARVDVSAAHTTEDHDKPNDTDADVRTSTAGRAGQRQQTTVDGAAGKQRD